MLTKVISGGQTGADQAGWRVARAFGIPTGGFMPLGFLTEDGPRPDLAEAFGATELPTADYPTRTRRNAAEADATVWFGSTETPGARTTLGACRRLGRPFLIVEPGESIRPSDVAAWIREHRVEVVNVAGNRESNASGIGARVERFLMAVSNFCRLINPRFDGRTAIITSPGRLGGFQTGEPSGAVAEPSYPLRIVGWSLCTQGTRR